jgi:WD40 repeat protein
VFHWTVQERQDYSTVEAKNAGQYASACFSTTGRVIAGNDEGFLDVFSAAGTLEGSVEVAGDAVQALAAVPEAPLVLAGSRGGTVALVDVAKRQILRRWGVPGANKDLCVSPDERYAIAACWDKTCRVWELETGLEVFSLPHRTEVFAVAYSPDGAALATACSVINHPDARDLLSVYDARTGQRRYAREKGRDRTYALAFTRDGRQLRLAGGRPATPSGTVLVDVADGKAAGELTGHNELVERVAVTRDGRRAVTASHDKPLRVWDLRDRGEVLSVACDEPLRHLAVAADDSAVAAITRSGKLILLGCPRRSGAPAAHP